MKSNHLVLILTWLVVIAAINVEAQQRAPASADSELFIKSTGEDFDKRYKAVPPEITGRALARFTDRYKNDQAELRKNILQLMTGTSSFICVSNVFWKDGVVQEPVIQSYLARLPLIPADAEKGWTEALAKVSDGQLKTPVNLGAIIVQDRLWEANSYKSEESRKLLIRMSSIPQDSIKKWADLRQLDEYQAAISLVYFDSLFTKDGFQPELFAKKLQEAAKK